MKRHRSDLAKYGVMFGQGKEKKCGPNESAHDTAVTVF